MGLVLGIDVSTTATKAVLIDEDGSVLGVGTAEYGFDVPHPLWSEQDPGLWWDGAVAAIGSVLRSTGRTGAEIEAVGLTGQMHGLVLLDESDRVLRPAILWNDQRTAAECDAIRAALGPERLIAITGNDALTGFTAPKLVWVRDHEPDLWRRAAHVLLPKDYLRLRLTGVHAMDKADGSGTLLFDLAARDWSARGPVGARDPARTGCRRRSKARRSPARSPTGLPPRPGCAPGRRSWRAAATSRPTRSVSGSCRRGRRRCRSGRRASCSPRPTARCSSHGAASTRSATRSRIAGT